MTYEEIDAYLQSDEYDEDFEREMEAYIVAFLFDLYEERTREIDRRE